MVRKPSQRTGAEEIARAGEAFDAWAGEQIAQLQASGLADVLIEYADFLTLTTFSKTRHIDSREYAEQIQAGRVVAITAGPHWTEGFFQDPNSLADDIDHEVAAEFMQEAYLQFPVAATVLVQWVRNQGGSVELSSSFFATLSRLPKSPANGVASTPVVNHEPKIGHSAGMSISEVARKGGEARNSDNKLKREQALAMYQTGDYGKNKEAAAEEISNHIGMAFGTVRNWLKGEPTP